MSGQTLFIAPLPPHQGGIASYSQLFLTHLKTRLSLHPLGYRAVFPHWIYPRRKAKAKKLPGVSYPFVGYLPFSAWKLPSQYPPPQWVIIPWWTAFLAPFLYCLLHRIRKLWKDTLIIFWCHNILGHEERWSRAWIRWLFRKVDGFIVHSEVEKERLFHLLDGKVPCVKLFLPLHPLPVPLPTKKEARERLKITTSWHIAFVGTIRKYKGLDLLLEGLPELVNLPDLTFTMAGEPWRGCRKYLQAFHHHGVSLTPRFLSWQEMADHLVSADALLLPFQHLTASGMVMMALETGTPVLASQVPGIEEYVIPGETGLLFPPEKDALIQTIQTFMKLRKDWEKAISAQKQRFSWDYFGDALEKFLGLLTEKVAEKKK